MRNASFLSVLTLLSAATVASARPTSATLYYGDPDLFGYGYPVGFDPVAGATISGLAVGTLTHASFTFSHPFPFSPSATDAAGTDQIYVGPNQTAGHDGYSVSTQRIPGPQVISFDYSSLVPAGNIVTGLTFGIAADDFQFPVWGDPFTLSLNGTPNAALTDHLNAIDQTGPFTVFLTTGVDPTILLPSNLLTLSINELGDGGDGWAVDFLTITVNTGPLPEPTATSLLAAAPLALVRRRR